MSHELGISILLLLNDMSLGFVQVNLPGGTKIVSVMLYFVVTVTHSGIFLSTFLQPVNGSKNSNLK